MIGVETRANPLRNSARRVEWDSAAAWPLGFVTVLYLAMSGGGYDVIARSEVGVLIWWLILVGALVGTLPRAQFTAAGGAVLLLFAAFLVWTWTSVVWTESDERTLIEVARIATYLGFLALALAVVRRGAARPLLNGVASSIGVVAGLAVVYRIAPSLFPADTGSRFYEVAQLQYPFEYSDALGEFVAMGLPGLAVIAFSARTAATRVAAVTGFVLAAICLALSASHGGLLAAVVGLALLAAIGPRHAWVPRGRRHFSLIVIAIGLALVIALAFATGLAHQLWIHFKSPSAAGQFSFSGAHRYQYWRAALSAFESSPWHGIGPGSFVFYWAQHNSLHEYVQNAHSLYFETLAETGIIGLLLLASLFALILIAGARATLRTTGSRRLTAAAGVAAFAAFCSAAASDWVWQIGAVPVAAMLLAAVALAPADGNPGRRQGSARMKIALVAASVGALWAIVVPLSTVVSLRKSEAAAGARRFDEAVKDAATAHSLEPEAASPWVQRGLIFEALNQPEPALQALSQAKSDEPTNWRVRLVESRVAIEANRPELALTDYLEARRLNPASTLFLKTARLTPISDKSLVDLLVPPGKAGANQYVEILPGAAGGLAPPSVEPTERSFDPRPLASLGDGIASAKAVERLSPDGTSAAELASATAYPLRGTATASVNARGDSRSAAIVSVLTGSDAGGLGWLLPALLAAGLGVGGWVMLRRSR